MHSFLLIVTLPNSQILQDSDPSSEYFPRLQSKQSLNVVDPVLVLYVPALHFLLQFAHHN